VCKIAITRSAVLAQNAPLTAWTHLGSLQCSHRPLTKGAGPREREMGGWNVKGRRKEGGRKREI